MIPPIVIKNIEFNISKPTHDLITKLKKYVEIEYKLIPPDNHSLGNGEFSPESSFKRVTVKINSNFQQHSDIIFSHEIIHLLMACERGFVFVLNKEQSFILGNIFSAFEHPTIVNIQNELGISDQKFIEQDFTHNLEQLRIFNSKHMKQNESYVQCSIVWADRANWGYDNKEISEALLILKQFPKEAFHLFRTARKNIAFFTKEPNSKNLVSGVHEIYSIIGMDKSYTIQRIN